MQWPQVTSYKCHTRSHNRMVRLGDKGEAGWRSGRRDGGGVGAGKEVGEAGGEDWNDSVEKSVNSSSLARASLQC